MKRFNVGVAVVMVALVLAACGGSSDESASTSSTSTSSSSGADQANAPSDDVEATSDNEDTETAGGGVEDHFDTAGGAATVTIGDETWEFALVDDIPIANCDADFFGGFVAILTNSDADMSSPMDALTVPLPGGDFTDPPTVAVNLAASGGTEWIADETIYEQNADLPAGLGVTAFSIDGATASGSASFFEQESFYQFNAGNGDLEVADGTFTVTCASNE